MRWKRNTQPGGPASVTPETVKSKSQTAVTRDKSFWWFLILAHRFQVLLFGLADVSLDFLIHSKDHLLRKRHWSDCVWALKITDIHVLSTDLPSGTTTWSHVYAQVIVIVYLPFAFCCFDLLVHIPAHWHQHHGIIWGVLQNNWNQVL